MIHPGADPDPDCDGPKGWAYVTGSVDGPGVHYGLLGIADDLVLSALDDRFFVASSASLSQDPPSAPAAWLIDSVTGQRGPLTWEDEPTTLNSAEQLLVLFPAHSIPWDTDSGERFLPRVVDRRDWTIRPLSVPDDATAALAIHQPGSGRIWIGTAPDGGEVGLAYTDDGGASWTDVELPEFVRPTSEELASVVPGGDELVVAATGDHVAVTQPWGGYARPVYVSADAGENWNSVLLDSDGNGRKLFVLSDDRLMLVRTWDLMGTGSLLVSSTPSDWSQLEEDVRSESLAGTNSMVDAYQHGLVVIYARSWMSLRRWSSAPISPTGGPSPDSTSAPTSHVEVGRGEAARGPNRDRRSAHQAEHGDPSEASCCGHRLNPPPPASPAIADPVNQIVSSLNRENPHEHRTEPHRRHVGPNSAHRLERCHRRPRAIPIAAGSSAASDETTSPDTTDQATTPTTAPLPARHRHRPQ